ncbi:hypothetical protein CKY10_14680 [Photorhabdus sp. HUG-39]|nr:hypothetical protein CKY10_14680 [Photorhabdus sp. HUG-39]
MLLNLNVFISDSSSILKFIRYNSAKNLITHAQEIKIEAQKSLAASGKSGVDIKGAKINLTQ